MIEEEKHEFKRNLIIILAKLDKLHEEIYTLYNKLDYPFQKQLCIKPLNAGIDYFAKSVDLARKILIGDESYRDDYEEPT